MRFSGNFDNDTRMNFGGGMDPNFIKGFFLIALISIFGGIGLWGMFAFS